MMKTIRQFVDLSAIAAAMLVGIAAMPVHAGVLFTESFETPNITGYTQGTTPTGWVKAAQGFNSSYHGLIDQGVDGAGVGLEFTPPSTQGYAFRYTNSGVTTAVGVIGTLRWGVTYTVSVDVVKDIVGATGTPYNIQLLAVASGAARDDCRSTPTGSTVLASASGNAPNTGAVQTITFNFTPSPTTHAVYAGYDLAVRFLGASDTANIDNVQVSATDVPIAYWDTNGTGLGAGGPAATGTWDGSLTNWNALADGTGTVAPWSGSQAVFAAGTDASAAYNVTVDGSRDISLLAFEEGSVTLANGTSGALNLTANTPVTVATGLTAIIAPPVTEDAAGRQLYKLGTGSLILSGNNAHTGATTVVQGILRLSGADNSAATGGIAVNSGRLDVDTLASINGTARNVSINSGGTLLFGASFGAGDIPTALLGRVVATSAGVIAADNYDTTAFDLNAAGLTAAYFGAVGSVNYSGALTPNGNYRLGGAGGTLTMANANALTGSGKTLTVNGPGTVNLANANNFTGATTVNSGATLILAAANTTGGTTVVNAGATLVVGDASSTGGSTMTLNGKLVIGSSSTFGSGKIFFSTGSQISSDSTTARSFNAVVQGNANNTIILGDAVNNGMLTATGNWMMSSSGTTYQCNSDIELSGSFQSSANAFTKTGSGTMIISGTNPLHTGPKTISAGTLSLTGSITGGAISTGTTGVLNQSSTGVISGAASLTQGSSGTSFLAGTNTYSGTTRVNTGTLTVNSLADGSSDSSIGSSTNAAARLVLGGGTFSYAPISAVGGAGAIIDRNFAVVANATLNASGTGALVFNQTGTISPDVTGLTFNATGSNKVLTALSSTADLVVGMRVTGTGIPANATIASIDSASQVTLTATANVTAGSGVPASFGYDVRTLTLAGTNTDANTIAGVLQNSTATGAKALSLTKTGIGTWVLSGANTYTGATAVNGGKLVVATGSGTRSNSAVTVANTAGCIFGVQLAAANSQWASSSSLTVAGANSQIEVDYNSTAPSTSTSEDPIKVTNLTVSGVGTLKVLGVTPSTPAGTYPLINFTGTGPAAADPYTGLTLSLPLGVTGKLTTTANHVNLVIEGGTTYTVTYDGNGSSGGMVPVDGSSPYATGATVTVLGNTGSLVKTGFVFTGWNTQADGLGTPYAPAATFPMGSANVILYADWKTPYQVWAGAVAFDADANNDGVSNGMAFLLGAANPSENAIGRLPTVTQSGGDLILNFNCLPVSARGSASLKVEHSSDLGVLDPWTATTAVVPDATNAVPDNEVTFVVGAGPVGPPALNSVTATIDSAAAAGGKLFGRLKAEQ